MQHVRSGVYKSIHDAVMAHNAEMEKKAKFCVSPKGFTLIQYITVITIISILSLSTQPYYGQLRQKYILLDSIKTIQRALQHARTLAIRKNVKTIVTPTKYNNWSAGIIIKINNEKIKT